MLKQCILVATTFTKHTSETITANNRSLPKKMTFNIEIHVDNINIQIEANQNDLYDDVIFTVVLFN